MKVIILQMRKIKPTGKISLAQRANRQATGTQGTSLPKALSSPIETNSSHDSPVLQTCRGKCSWSHQTMGSFGVGPCILLWSSSRSPIPSDCSLGWLENASEGLLHPRKSQIAYPAHSACLENRKISSEILHFSRMQGFPGKLSYLILSSQGAFFPPAETQVPATRAKPFN